MKGILGRKLGMTQVFTTDGVLIPVTVVEVEPNTVMQKKTVETDGYEAVQLGYEDVTEKRSTKAERGHAAKANTAPKRFIREIRADEMQNLEVGAQVKVDLFSAGDIVDVTGISKGKGYNGTIVRNNATMGPKTHGGSKNIRHIGSLATTGRNNGRIEKGTAGAGQEGGYTTTNQNLEVIKVDAENNYMLIKGNVPGPRRGLVIVKSTVKRIKSVAAKELLSYAGISVEEELAKVAETINEEAAAEAAAEAAKKEAK